jgi:hypothetical protein
VTREKFVRFNFRRPKQGFVTLFAMVVCLFGLFACGGGGVGEGGTGGVKTQNTGRVTGASDKTIEVNGVQYDKQQAKVVDGFNQPVSADRVTLGSWVDVESVLGDGNAQLQAQLIRVRPAMRGKVTQVDAMNQRLSVLGSQGQLDSDVIWDGVDGASQLREGDWVEVHGTLAQTNGSIDVTRLEKLNAPSSDYELRGVVTRVNATDHTMTVGGQKIDYNQASVAVRVALQEGLVVRVSSSQPPADGQRWVVDRVVDDQWLVGDAAQVYVEGVVTQFQAGPVFVLEGLGVDASGADKSYTVTGNGQRVAVVGVLKAGVLKAQAVRVVTPGEPVIFTLTGLIKQYKGPSDFRIGNVAINASTAKIVGGSSADLANGRKVRVRGEVLAPGLFAIRLEFVD